MSPRILATFVLAVGSGANLENLVVPDSLPAAAVIQLIERALGLGEKET